jgi:hypothetical protein
MGIKKEKPETLRKNGNESYKWDDLQKKGDWFELPEADRKQANSCRTRAKAMGLKVTVLPMKKGGYLVELREDRWNK